MSFDVTGQPGNFTLTGYAASVTNRPEFYVSGQHGVLIFTGFSAAVSGFGEHFVLGVSGALVFAGNVGTVITNHFVTGVTGALLLTGNAATVFTTHFVTGVTGALLLTGNAATVLSNYTTAFKSLVANLKTQAHSTYTNFEFNSLSGEYGAKSDGIYYLSGDTDSGLAIPVTLDTGLTDFPSAPNSSTPDTSSFLKRVSDAYIGCKSDGDIKLSLLTDNAETIYTITGYDELITAKLNLGRGAIGRYWQLKLENVLGSSFVIDSIELLAEITTRRVRGKPARTYAININDSLALTADNITITADNIILTADQVTL